MKRLRKVACARERAQSGVQFMLGHRNLILAFSGDCDEVMVFDSAEQANGWLEAIDVENRE